MKEWFLILIFCLSGNVIVKADFGSRTFTSKDGKKTLVATPVGYDRAKMVLYLRMKDKKIQSVELSKFSIADQLFAEDNKDELGELLRMMNMPRVIKSRFSKSSRQELLKSHKFAAGNEQSLNRFLIWLKTTQNADGSWSGYNKVSMTSLALLVYLGRGETPDSKKYGDSVTRAIVYLVQVAEMNRGRLTLEMKDKHWPYQHAIATLALAEAQAICGALNLNIPKLKIATKLAGDWILEHQHTSGSWDYGYDMSGVRGGDNSIGMWHVQALAACKLTGLWEENAFKGAIRNALEYVKSKQNANGGIGYASSNPSGENGYTLTGAGMYAFQLWGKSHDSVVRKGAKYIIKNTKFNYNTEHADLYRHYYHALAMKNRGGGDWDFYNRLLGKQLIENQDEDGSWKNVGGGSKIRGVATSYFGDTQAARHYRSCLCALILQTPYRYQWCIKKPTGVQPGRPYGK